MPPISARVKPKVLLLAGKTLQDLQSPPQYLSDQASPFLSSAFHQYSLKYSLPLTVSTFSLPIFPWTHSSWDFIPITVLTWVWSGSPVDSLLPKEYDALASNYWAYQKHLIQIHLAPSCLSSFGFLVLPWPLILISFTGPSSSSLPFYSLDDLVHLTVLNDN